MSNKKLFTVVVQDVNTNNVLMVAHADTEAIRRTRKSGELHLWSRSRQEYWKKGETSGNIMKVDSLKWDCDRDALLARVRPEGPACHEGTYSCFGDEVHATQSIFEELEDVFAQRKKQASSKSYSARLLKDKEESLKKVLEEAGEVVLAGAKGRVKKEELTWEAADLFFHTLLVLSRHNIRMEDIRQELERRRP